jgi:hypothetical protein
MSEHEEHSHPRSVLVQNLTTEDSPCQEKAKSKKSNGEKEIV